MKIEQIDTSFLVYTDANGGDPDKTSPTLKKYHKMLWSKPLPCGIDFNLVADQSDCYLSHKSQVGEYCLSSDSITHSYKNQKRKQGIVSQIPEQVDELYDLGSTIGAYIIFPQKRIDNKLTINGARGFLKIIDDRFDLTLECIKLFYLKRPNPLNDVLHRYDSFFRLFEDFEGYVKFFLLDDLIDSNGSVKFYMPFDNFQSAPELKSIDDYMRYKEGVSAFVNSRNSRIKSMGY
jgi:hypothetical protein